MLDSLQRENPGRSPTATRSTKKALFVTSFTVLLSFAKDNILINKINEEARRSRTEGGWAAVSG
jgi:hypothetical protein